MLSENYETTMTSVWLVEKNRDQESLFPLLAGNFAVRLVATPHSALKLLAMSAAEDAAGIVILNDTSVVKPMEVMGLLHALTSDRPHLKVLIAETSSSAWLDVSSKQSVEILDWRQDDPTNFIELMKAYVSEHSRSLQLTAAEGATKSGHQRVVVGDVKYDPAGATISVGDEFTLKKEVLSPKEARILEKLLSKFDQCVTRQEIATDVWPGIYVSERTLDTHVSRLRKKLSQSSECKLDAVYGKGYRFTYTD